MNLQSFEEVHDFCRHYDVTHLVGLRESEKTDKDSVSALITLRDKDRFIDKPKTPLSEVADCLHRLLHPEIYAPHVVKTGATETKTSADFSVTTGNHSSSPSCNINFLQLVCVHAIQHVMCMYTYMDMRHFHDFKRPLHDVALCRTNCEQGLRLIFEVYIVCSLGQQCEATEERTPRSRVNHSCGHRARVLALYQQNQARGDCCRADVGGHLHDRRVTGGTIVYGAIHDIT